MQYTILLATIPSAIITWATVFWVRRWAVRKDFVDKPGERKGHEKVTPLGGGFAIWAGIMLPFLLGILALCFFSLKSDGQFGNHTKEMLGNGAMADFIVPHLSGVVSQLSKLTTLLIAATLMMLLGLVDDKFHLDWRLRLLVQTGIASWIVSEGWRMSVFVDWPSLMFVLSVIWIVGIVNSFNMLDNMDGLSAGVAFIGVVILGLVMLSAPASTTQGPQLFVAGLLFIIAGALKGFLWHNSAPATIFMGDAGSYLIGFLIATCTLMATFAGEGVPQHAILAPLCILAVPIYDTLSVITLRLREGRSPFHADACHFSHRLVELGLSRKKAVWTIYLLTAATGVGALLLHQVNLFGAGIILFMVACVLIVIAVLETAARKR